MATITKVLTTMLTHAVVTNADTAAGLSVIGAEIDVKTAFSCKFRCYYALIEAAANNPGVEFHFQTKGSATAGVDDTWVTAWKFITGVTAGLSTVVNATEPIGEDEILVVTDRTASYAEKDEIYIVHTTLANSEWHRIRHLSATVITITAPLDHEQTNAASIVWNQAETRQGSMGLDGVNYIRMLMLNKDITGANIHIKADVLVATAVA